MPNCPICNTDALLAIGVVWCMAMIFGLGYAVKQCSDEIDKIKTYLESQRNA